jgi:hypothetical protein
MAAASSSSNRASKRKRDADDADTEPVSVQRTIEPEPASFETRPFLRVLLAAPCRLPLSYHHGHSVDFPCEDGDNMAMHIHRLLTVDDRLSTEHSHRERNRSPALKIAAAELFVPPAASTDAVHNQMLMRGLSTFEWLVHVTGQRFVAVDTWTPLNQPLLVHAIATSPQGSQLPPGVPVIIAAYVPTDRKSLSLCVRV